jgi:hydroxyacylglutathione hydrolase
MPLEIVTFVNGPFQNNTYLLADDRTGKAVVVDPSFDSVVVLDRARLSHWTLEEIWLTHAHFDHSAGAGLIAAAFQPPLPTRLHPDDMELWQSGGNAKNFGFHIDAAPEPSMSFSHGQKIKVGEVEMEVRLAPGHTQGHVILYCPAAGVLICGDVIFKAGIGRTDLPGSDYDTLIDSIKNQVLTLPDETRLLSGHGPETTVGKEKKENPFLQK